MLAILTQLAVQHATLPPALRLLLTCLLRTCQDT